MRIQDMEERTGLDRATIRYYEKEGLVTPTRHENGYRDYSEEDAQQLLKIKLLRQLGMSLEKIRALQQGSEDMVSAMQEQILQLRQQKKEVERSLDLCVQLRNDGVSYAEMDPERYLEQLTAPRLPETAVKPKNEPFHEYVAMPYHPWRHLSAKSVDIGILMLVYTLITILLYRTDDYSVMRSIGNVSTILLLIPLEALCYKLFATTPGKFLFGIKVLHADGCKHSFRSGFGRAFGAAFYGYALGIPILNIWRMWKSLRNYERGQNEWNKNSELIYKPYTWRQTVGWILVVVLVLGCVGAYIGMVETMPHYGKPITIAEFAENFNHNYRERGKENPTIMDKTGRIESSSVPEFAYEVKGGYLTGISSKERYTFSTMKGIFTKRHQVAVISLLASGEGENGRGMDAVLEEMKDTFLKQIKSGGRKLVYETEQATVVLEVIASRNYSIVIYGDELALYADNSGEGSATIHFSVTMK